MIALLFSLALLQQDPAADAPAEAVQTPVSEETGAAPQAGLDREAALADINAYLNGIGTLRADFVQVAPDGSAATGELAMEKRMGSFYKLMALVV